MELKIKEFKKCKYFILKIQIENYQIFIIFT
jgi:hypothetical protein